jgi:ribosomal protein L11 methyltransferase
MPKNSSFLSRPLLQFSLSVPCRFIGGSEFLKNFFERLGFGRGELVEEVRSSRVTVFAYRDKKSCSAQILRGFRSWRCRNVLAGIKTVLPKDWQDAWKDSIRPFALTRRFFVVPVWHMKKVVPPSRRPIFLDTTLAFGTGLHETTRFMARLIESRRGKFDSFLDIGTGTGILAIVAGFCGATRISALDIEKTSVVTARNNFVRNHLVCRVVRRDFRKFKNRERVDFAAANLVTEDLILMRRRLCAVVRPGGFLAVSGVALPNLTRVQQAFAQLPLVRLKVVRGRKWAAILFQLRK